MVNPTDIERITHPVAQHVRQEGVLREWFFVIEGPVLPPSAFECLMSALAIPGSLEWECETAWAPVKGYAYHVTFLFSWMPLVYSMGFAP